jgi:resuscitation-promoting factor RpfA
LSKCLKCGAELPPVGECSACAAATSRPVTPGVPGLLDKDIQIDRRRTPERTPAVSGPALPSFAELERGPAAPPGMTPRPPPVPQVQRIPTPPAVPQVQRIPTPPAVPQVAAPANTLAAPDQLLEAPSPMATAAWQDELPPPPSTPGAPPLPPEPVTSSRPVPTPVPVVTFTAPPRLPVPPPSSETIPAEEQTPRTPIPAFTPKAPEPSAVPPVAAAQSPSQLPSALPSQPRPRVTGPAAKDTAGVQEIHARPASLWRRLLSFTIDSAAIVGVAALYITLASTVAGLKAPSSQGLTVLDSIAAWMHALKSVLLPGVFLMLVLAVTYCAVAAFLWNGRTLGRVVLGLRLVDTHGLAPAPARAIVRALLSVVSFGLFLGGFWMALFDRRGQTLHDKLTSTFVVQPS